MSIPALDGTADERLRIAAAWALADQRTLLAAACKDGADDIARLTRENEEMRKQGRKVIEKIDEAWRNDALVRPEGIKKFRDLVSASRQSTKATGD